jgi:hypothetical protein
MSDENPGKTKILETSDSAILLEAAPVAAVTCGPGKERRQR